jgi:hypothetical protein
LGFLANPRRPISTGGKQMTSIYLIIFTLGSGLEIGYITGKTERLCDRMGVLVEEMEELWGQPIDAYCRDTGIPFLRPEARP